MLEIKNLTKIYHSELEGSLALIDVSIKFPEKGFVAITGESGSGKTTLLNILSGFISYEEGDFFVDGVNFLSFTDEDLQNYRRDVIGFVFQDYHLVEDHLVIDNLIEALLIVGENEANARKKSIEFLDKFGIRELEKQKVRSLSSGQKQKVAIARALIKEPKIVLCDEPTANLDYESGKMVLEILNEYAKDHLVIVSTHNYEDAQAYATHLIRIYKGKLTAYKEIKKIEDSSLNEKVNKKTKSSLLFLIHAKNHIFNNVFKTIVFGILSAIFTLSIMTFSAHIDDAYTKILNRSTFNNINPEEMLVMRKDKNIISEEDLLSLRNIRHLSQTQVYGLASEINYFYREDVDYEYKTVIRRKPSAENPDIYEEYTEKVFNVLKEDMYIKSYVGVVDESNLLEGRLPTSYLEVLADSSYEIGQTITSYFHDLVTLGNSFIKLDFKVVGRLKNKSNDIYFSPLFMKNMDYIQANSTDSKFSLSINYNEINKYTGRITVKTKAVPFVPLFNPSLNPLEIQLSENFIKGAGETFPKIDQINEVNAWNREKETKITVSIKDEYMTSEIDSQFIYVGLDIFNFFAEEYKSNTARVYVDDYSSLNEVIIDLTNNGYDCLSAYRVGSSEYDQEKLNQRAIILSVSIVLIAFDAFVYFLFGFILERNRSNMDSVLYLIGCSEKSLRKTSLLQILMINVLGFVLGIAIFFIISSLPIAFIQNSFLYFRFYHLFIVLIIQAILTFLIWLRYVQIIRKKIAIERRG